MRSAILHALFTGFLLTAILCAHAQGGTLPVNNNVSGRINSSTPDVWNVTTASDGLLRLTFIAASPADLLVALYDNNGTTIIGVQGESFNNSIVSLRADGLAPGTYHVKVSRYSASTGGAYTLADSLFLTPLNNDAEPNGTKATAIVLPTNGGKTGHVGYYYNNSRDTADWYKVTTTTDGMLRIYLSTDSGSKYSTTSTNPLDVNMSLYDNNGATQLGSVEVFNGNKGATGFITKDGLAPGTYYIKVQPYSTNQFANYNISDTLYTTTLSGDAEPNGNIATALTLPLNGGKTGHVGYYYNNLRDTADWYKVTTTTDGLLRIYLTSDSGSKYSTTTTNPLDVNVLLYDNNGTTQLGNVEVFNGYKGGTGFITKDGLAPGTYYIKVQPYSTSQFANYNISDTLYTTTVSGDAELNGNIAVALALPLNGGKTGHVGYYYNNLRDTADWYKVTTTTDGLLRIYLTSDSGSKYSTTTTNPLDVNVSLYDNNGTTQLGSVEVFNGYKGGTGFITKDGLAPGTYYIKVQPYSTSQFANYILSDTLYTTPLTGDEEPNATSAKALVLPLNGGKTGHVGYYYNNSRDTADWFKVTTTTDGLLRVYLTTDSGSKYSTTTTNPLDVNVSLYDNDGLTQLGSIEVFNSNKGGAGLITKDGLAPGTYYIKVQPYSTSEFANYSLSDTLYTSTIPSDVESNGSAATATAFQLGSITRGHVGYYYNKQRDTADWYKIIVPGTIPLHFYLAAQPTSAYSTIASDPIDMIMTIYRSDGIQIGSKEIFKGYAAATDSLFFPALAAGTYYVKITNYSTSEFAYYYLKNSLNAAGAALPVSFINFEGVLQNYQALLHWSTAAEINNRGFEVQKSTDGLAFHTIGFVNGQGNSAVDNDYTFTDTRVSGGFNYYRLKQVDLDGNFVFSSTIRLDVKIFDWSVAGNPINSNSWLQLNLAQTSTVAVHIITIDGKVIKTISKGTLAAGAYSIPLNLGNASAGIYIIQLITGSEVFSKTIIK